MHADLEEKDPRDGRNRYEPGIFVRMVHSICYRSILHDSKKRKFSIVLVLKLAHLAYSTTTLAKYEPCRSRNRSDNQQGGHLGGCSVDRLLDRG